MAHPKQVDLSGISGPGVELPTDKVLDRLGDEFIEIRDQKATLATKLGTVEKKIIERMQEKGLSRYRFGDQEAEVKESKLHVKIKTVKVDADGEDLENEDD